MDYQGARRRYLHDAEFKAMVDSMEEWLHTLYLTPGELREAATFAAVRFEMHRPPLYHLDSETGAVRQMRCETCAEAPAAGAAGNDVAVEWARLVSSYPSSCPELLLRVAAQTVGARRALGLLDDDRSPTERAEDRSNRHTSFQSGGRVDGVDR